MRSEKVRSSHLTLIAVRKRALLCTASTRCLADADTEEITSLDLAVF